MRFRDHKRTRIPQKRREVTNCWGDSGSHSPSGYPKLERTMDQSSHKKTNKQTKKTREKAACGEMRLARNQRRGPLIRAQPFPSHRLGGSGPWLTSLSGSLLPHWIHPDMGWCPGPQQGGGGNCKATWMAVLCHFWSGEASVYREKDLQGHIPKLKQCLTLGMRLWELFCSFEHFWIMF